MVNIRKVRKAQHDVEVLQSALAGVHSGLDTVETIVESADEVRRGFRRVVKLGVVLAIVGVVVAIVFRSDAPPTRHRVQPRSPELGHSPCS